MFYQWCTITGVGKYARVCSILRGTPSHVSARDFHVIAIGRNRIIEFFSAQTARATFEHFVKFIKSVDGDMCPSSAYGQVRFLGKTKLPITKIEKHSSRKRLDLKVARRTLIVGWPTIKNCCLDYSVVVLANFGGHRWLNPPI